ncbi:hypothetical protein BDL97_08G100700 [Sphagnum fallax]|jgi:hypothetical protein|uniref:Biogenesis of lysosome-related organelles complex 1 subunit 1 n=1 Tax=Sphagnum jensenii TaxID=128206 RepID=A0ABP0XF59_9BRYO|nr:hypothetical protein BDL97_08G100700 [Sphagnum fallax]
MEEGLEASFANMMQQHAHHSAHLRDRVQTSKKAALEAAAVVSDLLVESINGGVQEVFVNEKQIEMEARSMGVTVQRFSKQTSQWLNVIHTFDSALKEIGDFENWIKVMEYDCKKIAGTLRSISESSREQQHTKASS